MDDRIYIKAYLPKQGVRVHDSEEYESTESPVASVAFVKKYQARIDIILRAIEKLYEELEIKGHKPSEVLIFNSEGKQTIFTK
jgi:hypothetical protein